VFHNIGSNPYPYASTVLACLAVVVTGPIYIFYWNGPKIRAKSKFAQTLAADAKSNAARGMSIAAPEGEKDLRTDQEQQKDSIV
jgi:hypothetical protein